MHMLKKIVGKCFLTLPSQRKTSILHVRWGFWIPDFMFWCPHAHPLPCCVIHTSVLVMMLDSILVMPSVIVITPKKVCDHPRVLYKRFSHKLSLLKYFEVNHPSWMTFFTSPFLLWWCARPRHLYTHQGVARHTPGVQHPLVEHPIQFNTHHQWVVSSHLEEGHSRLGVGCNGREMRNTVHY